MAPPPAKMAAAPSSTTSWTAPTSSPADGKVTGIKRYRILGRYADVEMHVRLAHDPSLLLVLTHLTRPKVEMGDVVACGDTVLGAVRGFPTTLDQPLSRYTSDTGDHVQMMVLRVTPAREALAPPVHAHVQGRVPAELE